MKECICCGLPFEVPTGEDVHPPSYEYCKICILWNHHLDCPPIAFPVGPSKEEA